MDGQLAEYAAGPENHDAPVFDDDSVEIFLQPGVKAFWRLAVNALGATYDAMGLSAGQEDRSMNLRWKAVATRKSNRWIVEASIDLSSLAADPPEPGEAWGFNVVRNERPLGETSTWAPLGEPAGARVPVPGRVIFTHGDKQPKEKIADPDLLGHWTCDDVQGPWLRDASGHRRHGRMTSPMKQVEGWVGKALEFEGQAFVDFTDAPDLNLVEAMTLALWVCPKRVGSMRLIDKGPVGGSDGYLLDTHPTNNLRVITRAGSMTCKEALPVGKWSHVAATFGQRTLRVYLDGRQIAETANLGATLTATAVPLRLGADSEGGSRFVGLMDDVRIYRRALSPDEISKLADRTRR
jgi:hypothetical protein